jgi:FdhD protein
MTLETAAAMSRLRWTSAESAAEGLRTLAEETPVALTHDGSTTAVMMATPADLEDFGVGFSLTEGLVEAPDEIGELEIAICDLGVEVRMWLAGERAARLAARRRRLAGPTGCGLCGLDSLAEAARPARRLEGGGDARVTASQLLAAMAQMEAAQSIGPATRAVHAAGLWTAGGLLVREDVGRHNALDKLVGAAARAGLTAGDGVLLLTSRVSVEMVQKAAVLGAPILCAMSAPTALAVRTAEAAGLTLVAVARADGFEVFTHPGRVALE